MQEAIQEGLTQAAEEKTTDSATAEVAEIEVSSEPAQEVGETKAPAQEPIHENSSESVPMSRFNKVYFEKKEAERKIAEMELKLKDKESYRDLKEPTLEEYNYDEEKYNSAIIDYRADKKVKEILSQRRYEEQENSVKTLAMSFEDEEVKARTELKDYDSVARSEEMTQVYRSNPELAVAVMELGPEVAYEFGKNPVEADRIAGMTPFKIGIALGAIKNRVDSRKRGATPLRLVPEPINPLAGNKVDKVKNLSDISFTENAKRLKIDV